MPSKRKAVKSKRGARGARGPKGPAGVPGKDAPAEAIERLTRELEAAQGELRVQFTRIAQLQAEVDALRREQHRPPEE